MRYNTLCLIAALTVAGTPFSAGAVQARADRQAAAGTEQTTSAAYTCPTGYYWEPDAYAPHGKFRPAHCARRW